MTLPPLSKSALSIGQGTGGTFQEPVSEEISASPAASDHSGGSQVPYYVFDPNGYLFLAQDEPHQPWLVEVSKFVAVEGTLRWTMFYTVLNKRFKGQHTVEYVCNPNPRGDKRDHAKARYTALASSVYSPKTKTEFSTFLDQISYSEDYKGQVSPGSFGA